jgi:hypothetical protein
MTKKNRDDREYGGNGYVSRVDAAKEASRAAQEQYRDWEANWRKTHLPQTPRQRALPPPPPEAPDEPRYYGMDEVERKAAQKEYERAVERWQDARYRHDGLIPPHIEAKLNARLDFEEAVAANLGQRIYDGNATVSERLAYASRQPATVESKRLHDTIQRCYASIYKMLEDARNE